MKFLTTWVVNILLITLKMDPATSKSLHQNDESIDLSHYGKRLFGSPSRQVGLEVANWKADQSRGNPEELGSYLEGDILFPSANSRSGLVAETSHWPNGKVPFEIVGDFSEYLKSFNLYKTISSKRNTVPDAIEMDTLEKAINAYHDNTCIKFVPRTSSDVDYISIQGTDSGCWSSVGRVGGRQVNKFCRVCPFIYLIFNNPRSSIYKEMVVSLQSVQPFMNLCMRAVLPTNRIARNVTNMFRLFRVILKRDTKVISKK